jgi:hypothetical protein
MKTIARSTIYLAIMAIILTASLAVPAAAKQQVPFQGVLQGNDTDTCFSFPIVCVSTIGTGESTLLGKFSFTLELIANVATFTDAGSAHFIAANGDTIDTTFVGSAVLTDDPNVISITEIFTVTGGTGRFAGAQGSFIVERLASGATFTTSGSFDGTITSPGAAHAEADED